jgi:photosystem II stability/assembly factor-like uncharacterized protein
VRRFLIASGLLAFAFTPTPSPLLADEKPPLTKEQEREKFHPRRLGMDAETRLAGWARRQQMEKESPLAGLRFRNVGPEIQGGRVVDIAAPANRPDSLIVAFASGGLWRTDSRGGTWTPLFDTEPTLTIGAFALGDREGKVLYVGTGEANSSRTSYAGIGISQSTDGGKHWQNMGLTDSHHIGRVLVDPRDSNIVLVAAMGHLYTENSQRGVYRTSDGGKTWSRTLFVNDRTGAIDLAADPKNPDTVYAATWERARTAGNFLESGPGSGIWKSTDGGKTWKRAGTGFPTGATVGRIGLAVAASRPETIYAVLDNQTRRPASEPVDEEAPPGEVTPRRLKKLTAEELGRVDDAALSRFLRRGDYPKALTAARLKKDLKSGAITVADLVAYLADANADLFENEVVGTEVYRSDDAGGTWKRTHEGRIDKVFYSYGYYFARIAVDPTDPERIYIHGVPFLGSSDGGKTWKGLGNRGVHGDHHTIWIDPTAPQRLALGNDGGINVSYDYGETWTKLNNLPVGQFTILAVDDADPYNIVGGLQDNGVMRGPSTYKYGKSDPQAWKSIYGGDGSCVAIDPKDSNVVYVALQFGNAARLNLKTNERARIKPRPQLSAKVKEKPLRYNWIAPFVLSPQSNNILYYGTQKLYRSFDRGDTWTAISQDLTSNREQGDVPFGTITTIAESPKKFGVIWVGTDEGKVWGTRDGGANWTDLSAGLAKAKWVTRVTASFFEEGTVYVTQSGYRDDDFAPYVFRSTDYGKTWQSLASGLPAEPVNVVREDPKARHLLYIGTDGGVFVSLDRGSSWKAMAGGLPHVAVQDLVVQKREGDLVVGTHGRSVYVAEAAPLRKLTPAVVNQKLHAFPVKTIKISPRRGYGEDPWFPWFRDDPSIRIAYWTKGGEPVHLTVKDENGSVWKELDGPSAAGINVVDYDLSSDPKLADAAESKAREKALAKEKEKEKEKEKDKAASKDSSDVPAEKAATAEPPREARPSDVAADRVGSKETKPAVVTKAAPVEDEEEEDEEKPEKEKPPAGPAKPLDPQLYKQLEDPLRSTRKRYLPPGKYTVEVRVGSATDKTTLEIKPEPERSPFGED